MVSQPSLRLDFDGQHLAYFLQFSGEEKSLADDFRFKDFAEPLGQKVAYALLFAADLSDLARGKDLDYRPAGRL